MPENELRNISELTLVYRSAGTGKLYDQPASGLDDSGTLIDPDGPNAGEDMELVGYRLV